MTPRSLSPEIVVVPADCMEKACWENGLMLAHRHIVKKKNRSRRRRRRKRGYRTRNSVTAALNYT